MVHCPHAAHLPLGALLIGRAVRGTGYACPGLPDDCVAFDVTAPMSCWRIATRSLISATNRSHCDARRVVPAAYAGPHTPLLASACATGHAVAMFRSPVRRFLSVPVKSVPRSILTPLLGKVFSTDLTPGALPRRAPSTRCTAESMRHVWHRWSSTPSLAALAAQVFYRNRNGSDFDFFRGRNVTIADIALLPGVSGRAAHGALPHRAPSTRCTADRVHRVWHR